MALSSVSSSRFKKMVMKATGTKGYLSSSVQNSLRASGSQKYLRGSGKVTRAQATKVMKQLKKEGLASKISSNATKHVKRAFAAEEQRKDMIKKQNIEDRKSEIAAEKAAEQAKAGGKKSGAKQSAGAGAVQMSHSSTITAANAASGDKFVGNSFGSTDLKPLADLPTQVRKPQEWIDEEADLIDMAID